jgi:hypothetical protein
MGGGVIVEGGEAALGLAEVGAADPPVEVEELGLVELDNLGGAGEPVVAEGLGDVSEVFADGCVVGGFEAALLGGSVEAGEAGIIDGDCSA